MRSGFTKHVTSVRGEELAWLWRACAVLCCGKEAMLRDSPVLCVAAAVGETETGREAAERPGPSAEDPVLWSPEVEVCLFHAMLGHKPVGEFRPQHIPGLA